MDTLLILFSLCVIISNVHSWRFFHNGRARGGNLGIPRTHELTDTSENFTKWFTQYLDHFDVENQNTWQQRYFINDEFLDKEKRNVAFLLIGGEGEASDAWMTKGAWIDNAKSSKAILFQLEHRFYGKSHPTEDLRTENLRHLTSVQALADLAVFVDGMNDKYNLSSEVKWIAFGGSYSGSLAAWLRLKYPHLIHGAISTSGPLLAKPNFKEYLKVVSDDLREVSEDCYTAAKAGTAQVEEFMGFKEGQKRVTELFKLCESIEDHPQNDVANFYSALADNFAGIAQYNKDNRVSTQGTLLGNITLDTVCDIMTTNKSEDEINRLANFNALMLEATGQQCLHFSYDAMINSMKSINWDTAEGGRQWTYQTCNEFGFYQTSDDTAEMFSDTLTLDFSIQQCIDVFGPQFNATYLDAATEWTNIIYGALDIKTTNVVYVHGSVDPWHKLGITSATSEDVPAIFINGTAHCADMYPPSDDDLPQLKAARDEIGQYIQTWLNL